MNFKFLIVIWIIFMVIRAIAKKATQAQQQQQQQGRPQQPLQQRQPVSPAGTRGAAVQRPSYTQQTDAKVTWQAPPEQIDRYLGGIKEEQMPVQGGEQGDIPPMFQSRAGMGQVPPTRQRPVPVAQPQAQPIPQLPMQTGQQRPAASSLAQLLQMPAQMAAAQQQMAQQQQQLAHQRAELERQRRALHAERLEQQRQPVELKPVAVPSPYLVEKRPSLHGPADLRRAIVLAEVLGPPKALRHKKRSHTGMV